MKIIAKNKKAFFEYEFSETIEAGVVLSGNEVKSAKDGHVSLAGSYAILKSEEIFLINCKISKYKMAYSGIKINEERSRKLLLAKKQIKKLEGQVSTKGITIIPLKIYINGKGLIKVEVGIGKHKKLHDKREKIKERDLDREAKREIFDKNKF
jgi:SsrA-binding protein